MKVNDIVAWKWGFGLGQGRIVSIHKDRVQVESKGKIITRVGSIENPALVIEHKSGNLVLKLASEVQVID